MAFWFLDHVHCSCIFYVNVKMQKLKIFLYLQTKILNSRIYIFFEMFREILKEVRFRNVIEVLESYRSIEFINTLNSTYSIC